MASGQCILKQVRALVLDYEEFELGKTA